MPPSGVSCTAGDTGQAAPCAVPAAVDSLRKPPKAAPGLICAKAVEPQGPASSLPTQMDAPRAAWTQLPAPSKGDAVAREGPAHFLILIYMPLYFLSLLLY